MQKHRPEPVFTVTSAQDGGSEGENRFLQTNGSNVENPIYKLEKVLRVCNQRIPTLPDRFGVIKRNPRAEHNPLLCNLKDQESTKSRREQ